MANTYTQLHIHIIFGVKFRAALILPEWKAKLYMYITGIVQNHGHKMLIINGVEDHVHMLIGLRPNEALSTLVQEVKRDSSRWINDNRLSSRHFNWQGGYGAFSYSKSQIPVVMNYIRKQEEHHRKKPFIDEYKELLKRHDVDYEDAFIFKDLQ